MLLAMTRSLLVLAIATLTCFASTGCSKDKKDDGDAAADAAAVDAAPEAAVDAGAVDAADAAATPLTTAVPVRPKATAVPIDPPICVNARAARARNSPAAATLEAQCRAQGGKP